MLGRIWKAICDFQDAQFRKEVDRIVALRRASTGHPVDLDQPQAIRTRAGASIWVSRASMFSETDPGENIVIFVSLPGAPPDQRIPLHHTEAQWLLKAIRQQNNIVKQRLSVTPIEEPFARDFVRHIAGSARALCCDKAKFATARRPDGSEFLVRACPDHPPATIDRGHAENIEFIDPEKPAIDALERVARVYGVDNLNLGEKGESTDNRVT